MKITAIGLIFISILAANSIGSDRGLELYYARDYNKAETEFKKAIESNTINNSLAYYYLGLIKYLKGDQSTAISYWSSGKNTDPQFFQEKIFRMPSGSMKPTLEIGDHILVDIEYYKYNKPNRNDLAVLISPQDNKTKYVKRIVAIEGDTIAVNKSKVYVNGKLFSFPFKTEIECPPTMENFVPVTINKDSVFVIGDNICNSFDSRQFRAINRSALIGKALAIYGSATEVEGKIEMNEKRIGIILK